MKHSISFKDVWALFEQRDLPDAYRSESQEVIKLIIKKQFESGQWVTEFDDSGLCGWACFLAVDSKSLALLKVHGFLGCLKNAITLAQGNHLYISNAVTRLGCDPKIYRRLHMQILSLEGSSSVSLHVVSKRGGRTWWHHQIKER